MFTIFLMREQFYARTLSFSMHRSVYECGEDDGRMGERMIEEREMRLIIYCFLLPNHYLSALNEFKSLYVERKKRAKRTPFGHSAANKLGEGKEQC